MQTRALPDRRCSVVLTRSTAQQFTAAVSGSPTTSSVLASRLARTRDNRRSANLTSKLRDASEDAATSSLPSSTSLPSLREDPTPRASHVPEADAVSSLIDSSTAGESAPGVTPTAAHETRHQMSDSGSEPPMLSTAFSQSELDLAHMVAQGDFAPAAEGGPSEAERAALPDAWDELDKARTDATSLREASADGDDEDGESAEMDAIRLVDSHDP